MAKQQGFTLIELMIVVALIAVISAAAALAIPPAGQRQLQEEATRMGQVLEVARAHSRASGLPVRMQVSEQAFKLEGSPTVEKMSGSWLHKATHAPVQTLYLGPEPVLSAQKLTLYGEDGQQLVLGTDGVRPFAVVEGS